MNFTPTRLAGVYLVEPTPHADERGFFARIWCRETFAAQGLTAELDQTSVSFNRLKGTLRGMHLQAAPLEEAKLVRCTRGAIAAVTVDVRPESQTFGDHLMVELNPDNQRTLFLPPYVAHGFQTLADETEVSYQISGQHMPAFEQGFRWNDPEFGIVWPLPVTVMSEQDAGLPSQPAELAAIESAASW